MPSSSPTLRLGFAICTRNRPAHLKRCLDSLLGTTRHIEDAVYWVVDDASDDETGAYLETVVQESPFLQWASNDWHGGITVSFNRATELLYEAGCDLMFVVNDDISFKKAGWAELYASAVAKSGIQHFNFMDGRNLVGRRELDGITLSYHSWVRGCLEVLSREAHERAGGYDASLGDLGCMDTDLADRTIDAGLTDDTLKGLADVYPLLDGYGLESMGFCADVDGIREYIADPHPNMGACAEDSGYPNKQIAFNLLQKKRLERCESRDDIETNLTVLLYHQILVGGAPCDPSTDFTYLHDFEAHVQLLDLLGYDLIGLNDLVSGDLPEKAALITMDDGYRGQVRHAVPFLAERGIRPALFLTAGRIGATTLSAYESLRWLLEHVPFERLAATYRSLARSCMEDLDADFLSRTTRSPAALRQNFRWVVELGRQQGLVDALEQELGVRVDHGRAAEIQPTWTEIEAIATDADFGAHGVEHHLLAALDSDDLEREITMGSEILYEHVGPIDWFAYPFGFEGSYDSRAVMLLYQLGFSGAFTAMPGRNPNPLEGMYHLNRISVGDQSAEDLFRTLLLQR